MRTLLGCLLLCLIGPLAAAERVVSLAPSLSEIMLDLQADDLLVGVLDGGERPPALAHLPSVGRWGQLQMEALLALKPDLVLLWPSSVSATEREQLQRLGLELMVVEPGDLDSLAEQFALVGARVGRRADGERLRDTFRERVQQLRARYARARPLRVFYQVWDTPLYTLGGQQIVSDALKVCGAQNLFADLHLPAPQVSVEAVLQRDPEVLLAADARQLEAWRRWPQMAATAREQLWVLPDKGLERPSWQMLAATERLCEVLAGAR
ncbi:MAG: cobalamin-binding protein [Gammaproteobacteria bacterium]|nr:cobalamin-binding protein [Gammaproteobacteria bacterium]MBU1488992.1 cobalamin-binding protein [Gammaproteobacteria bacterium]MBU2325597.1 cobalamin-binding protein [Gammaproteobacteria bacterium]